MVAWAGVGINLIGSSAYAISGTQITWTWRNSNQASAFLDVVLDSGQWYMEFQAGYSLTHNVGVRLSTMNFPFGDQLGDYRDNEAWQEHPDHISYRGDGQLWYDQSGNTFGSAYTGNDIIGVAIDATEGKIWFSKNGVWQGSGNPATGANPAYTYGRGYSFRVGISTNVTNGWYKHQATEALCDYSAPSGFYYLDESSSSSSSSLSSSSSSRSSSSRSLVTGKWDSSNLTPEAHSLSNKDRTVTHSGTSDISAIMGLPSKSAGRWYFETKFTTHGAFQVIGIANESYVFDDEYTPGGTAYEWVFRTDNRRYYNDNTQTGSIGSSLVDGDIVGVAFDISRGRIWFSVNGVWQNSPTEGQPGEPHNNKYPAMTGITGNSFTPVACTYIDGDVMEMQGDWYDQTYSAPTGFLDFFPMDWSFSSSSSSSTSSSSSSRSSSSTSESSSSRSSSSSSRSSSSRSSSSSSRSSSSSSSSSRSSSSSSSSSCRSSSSSSRSSSSSSSSCKSSSSSSAAIYDIKDGWEIGNAGIFVGNNDRVATMLSSNSHSCLSKWIHSHGKFYWEVDFPVSTYAASFGIALRNQPYEEDDWGMILNFNLQDQTGTKRSYAWHMASGYIWSNYMLKYDPGAVYMGRYSFTTGLGYNDPHTLMMALDIDRGRFWVGVDGDWIGDGGNPETPADPETGFYPTYHKHTFDPYSWSGIYLYDLEYRDYTWDRPIDFKYKQVSAAVTLGNESNIAKSRFADWQWEYEAPEGFVSPLTLPVDVSSSSSSSSSASTYSSSSFSSSSSSSRSCYMDHALHTFTGNDGDRANNNMWDTVEVGRIPHQLRIKDNQLRFISPVGPDKYESYIQSRFTISGDFDVRVEFGVEEYLLTNAAVDIPNGDSVFPELAVYSVNGDNKLGSIKRFFFYEDAVDEYDGYEWFNGQDSVGGTYYTDHPSLIFYGTLRIVRESGVIKCWYHDPRYENPWAFADNFDPIELNRDGVVLFDGYSLDVYFRVYFSRYDVDDPDNENNWGYVDAWADNFQVYSADNINCLGSLSLSSSSSSLSTWSTSSSCSCSSSSTSWSSSSSSFSTPTEGLSSYILSLDPEVYYKFDETSGTTMVDAANKFGDNRYDGLYSGDYTLNQTSLVGDGQASVDFSDGRGCISAITMDRDNPGTWAIAGVFKPTTVEAGMIIASSNEGEEVTYYTQARMIIGIDPAPEQMNLEDNLLSVSYFHRIDPDTQLSNRTVVKSTTPIVAGNTYAYAVVCNGESIKLYLNGVLEGESFRTGYTLSLEFSARLCFGDAYVFEDYSRSFQGTMDDSCSFFRELSYMEVSTIAYKAGLMDTTDGRHWGWTPPSPSGYDTLQWSLWNFKGHDDSEARYDTVYGSLMLNTGEEVVSNVVDFGDFEEGRYKEIVIDKDQQSTGRGNASIQYRLSNDLFTVDASSPSWQNYTGEIHITSRYFQVKVTAL